MKSVFPILLCVLFLAVACGGSAPADTEEVAEAEPVEEVSAGDAAAGETEYQSLCSACHGPEALGVEGLGRNLIESEFALDSTDTELVEFIKEGRPGTDPDNTTGVDMPPRGGNPALTDDDILNIVAYLRTLQE